MVKAIFFDIDGTLVSFKTHQVPQSTLDAIHRVREKGLKVFIATGRPLPFINNLQGLEYDGIMCVNGACCITNEGKIIGKHPVPKEDIQKLIEDQKTHPMPVAFATNEKAVVCNIEAGRENFAEVFKLLNLSIPQEVPMTDALDMDVMQVIAFFDAKDEERIMTDVLKGCDAARWHPYFADCIHKGMSKASGIDEMCHYYGFDVSETMAFGDGGNDIAMLRHAGTGVAMGNASDEVKAHADIVTTSVDEDGIANILNKL